MSVHNTKANYKPTAIFQGDITRKIWNQLLEGRNIEGRNTKFSEWLEDLEKKNDLKERLETVFYDEVMIQPLVSELERRRGDPELFHDLMHIGTLRTAIFQRLYLPTDFCDHPTSDRGDTGHSCCEKYYSETLSPTTK